MKRKSVNNKLQFVTRENEQVAVVKEKTGAVSADDSSAAAQHRDLQVGLKLCENKSN